MLNHGQMDPRLSIKDQLADKSDEPVILINLFDVDTKDNEHFKVAWSIVSKTQPRFLSAQLHQGIGNSSMWLNYAVFESAGAFSAMTLEPEFGPLSGVYLTAQPPVHISSAASVYRVSARAASRRRRGCDRPDADRGAMAAVLGVIAGLTRSFPVLDR